MTTHPHPFDSLLARVANGDQAAALEFVQQYQSEILRVVRLRMWDRRLRATHDSMDVVQSVFASLFVEVATGTCRIESPEELLKLLARKASNKVADVARRANAARRDVRRTQPLGELESQVVDRSILRPEEEAELSELVGAFQSELSDEERAIAEMRRDGGSWEEVADRFGGTPDARRIAFSRTIHRVSGILGLDLA